MIVSIYDELINLVLASANRDYDFVYQKKEDIGISRAPQREFFSFGKPSPLPFRAPQVPIIRQSV